jgi:hypothetical protein
VVIEEATMDEATKGDDESAGEDDEKAEIGVVIVEEMGSKELSFCSSDTIK